MRGTFRNPPPGRPRPRPDPADPAVPGSGLGAPVDDDHLDDPAARANFRVVVLVPTEVDQVDLARADDPRRWFYRYVGDDGEEDAGNARDDEGDGEVINGWKKWEVWP
ncbi:zn 2cys6 transcription factor [Niveomyces insectorum RCEF 264]|uniref:Zn 2cys6 transcription factor n=1 Tax=Niveomyces insectorum RCEF 264 TaxID=1081102 RepID=A0A167QZ19_9HYPO|nr:zn 2cys6 transcription factor [Niveomyces insectorum RCEF 264]